MSDDEDWGAFAGGGDNDVGADGDDVWGEFGGAEGADAPTYAPTNLSTNKEAENETEQQEDPEDMWGDFGETTTDNTLSNSDDAVSTIVDVTPTLDNQDFVNATTEVKKEGEETTVEEETVQPAAAATKVDEEDDDDAFAGLRRADDASTGSPLACCKTATKLVGQVPVAVSHRFEKSEWRPPSKVELKWCARI